MIFEKIYEKENLEEAWKRVRARRSGPGIDRIKWEDFEKNLNYNLETIGKQLENESYRPLPVMIFRDRKAGGEHRTIGISTVRDKVVQHAVAGGIGPLFEKHFLPCSYAYRPKKSALSAVKKANQCIKDGNLWLLKMDVADFFDSIDHTILLDLIKRVVDEKPVHRLISRLLKTKIFKEMGLFDTTIGSQQGSGLSPLLSNIYLHPLDEAIWKRHKDRYIRYSDDIAVFSMERETLEEARSYVEKCLFDLKLSANSAKTATSHVSGGVLYLGYFMDIKGKGPDKKSVKELENKLSRYNKIRKTDNIQEKLMEICTRIRGWYNYYKTLKPITPPNILSLIALVHLAREFDESAYARELLRQTEKFQHNYPEISFQTAELFFEFGMNIQAMKNYAQAIEYDPSMEKAKERIKTLQEGEENLYQVIEKTKMVLHHNPRYQEGYRKLAECYMKLGLYGFAEKAHQKALEIEEDTESDAFRMSESIESLADQKDFDYSKIDQEAFLQLFRGRKNAHARQWVDDVGKWGFMHVDRSLKVKDIYRHLMGETTLGVYPVTEQETVHFIVFDVDAAKRSILEASADALDEFRKMAHEDILRIKTICENMGLFLYIEDSGYKGRHGWLFFADELPASWAVHLGNEIMKKAGGPSPQMVWELFPMGKSERHRSIIKIPLGINKKSNRHCLFLADNGDPVEDQAILLLSIEKSDIKKVKHIADDPGHTEKEGISYDKQGDILAPPGIETMVNRCKMLKHLIEKARDTNYLNHHERICILYTLSFAGEPGCKFLHQVISYCINYDYHYTQRQIERRKESPISCAKIMENFPELAETLSCDCKFKLPPRSYPSPVLYLLEAEIEDTIKQSVFSKYRNNKADEREMEKKDNKEENNEEAKDSILDFESIFSDESHDEPPYDDSQDSHEDSDESALSDQAAIDEGIEPAIIGSLEKESTPFASEYENETKALPTGESRAQADIWELFIEYLKLKTEQEKIAGSLNQISHQLSEKFDRSNSATIHTTLGRLQKLHHKDGRSTWLFEISDERIQK